MKSSTSRPAPCAACKEGVEAPFPFSMAFQPIVDVEANRIYAFEALVRGVHNESAGSVLAQVNEQNRYAFDQNCRVQAIALAARLGLPATGACLSINFMPGAVYSPAACIRLTLETARGLSFPMDRLIFEITESEEVLDRGHLVAITQEYHRHGFQMAIDDFGAGFSGFNLLAEIEPDVVKLDMALIREISTRPTAIAIVESLLALCHRLGITVIAEGVETVDEYVTLRQCGVRLMQGYLLAKPGFESLPEFTLPVLPASLESGLRLSRPGVPPFPSLRSSVHPASLVAIKGPSGQRLS